MNILALETATEACSAALSCAGRTIARFELAPRQHAQRIFPMIDEILAEAGLAKSQLDAIAAGRGPGAFTGVRLALSIAQGTAFALDRPLIPISSLAALAWAGAKKHGAVGPDVDILAVLDARMHEAYVAHFAFNAQGQLSAKSDEQVIAPAALQTMQAKAWLVVGNGLAAYRQAVLARLNGDVLQADAEVFPTAEAVAVLAAAEWPQGLAMDPAQAQPIYLRDKVALTLEEQNGSAP